MKEYYFNLDIINLNNIVIKYVMKIFIVLELVIVYLLW